MLEALQRVRSHNPNHAERGFVRTLSASTLQPALQHYMHDCHAGTMPQALGLVMQLATNQSANTIIVLL